MAKVGRNLPCPCGSGKKYKKCCLGKTDQSSNVLPWKTYPEDFVIAELLQSSKEFLLFYQNERMKIINRVFWAHDLSLPTGINYRATKLDTGDYVIRLKTIPAILKDAIKIAHELQHCLDDIKGFHHVGFRENKYENLSSSLNSMVGDPIVNLNLGRYDFDLSQEYERELEETLYQLKTIPPEPTDHLGRVRWVINYAAHVLERESLLNKEVSKIDNRFESSFDDNYPAIASEARCLLELIRDIGFNTPQKQFILFNRIIQKYALKNYLTLN